MPYFLIRCSVLRAYYIKMFVLRCSSFCCIVPCSFESILMPTPLVQECYMMLTAVTYQNLVICYFCCNWCVHLMGMSSTGVLIYAMPYLQGCMPCIFVISLMTRTSMQSPCPLLFCCHVNLMLQRDPCIFWDTSVRVFWTYGYALSIHALGCNYGVV